MFLNVFTLDSLLDEIAHCTEHWLIRQ